MKRFDYRAAKASGVSDADIAKYLDEKNAAGDSMYIDRTDLQPASAPPMAMTQQSNPASQFLNFLKGHTATALPDVGGFIGAGIGTVGGVPGRIVGAGIGGGVGEVGKELMSGEQLNPGKIAGQGASQAALQGTGEAIVGGIAKVAPGLMKRAIGSVGALTTRFDKTPEDFAAMLMKSKLAPNQAGRAAAKAENVAERIGRGQILARTQGTVGAKTIAKRAIKDTEEQLGRTLTSQERASLIAKVQSAADEILTERSHGVVPKPNAGTPAKPASSILDEFGRPAIEATEAVPGKPSRYSARELEQIKEVAAKAARGQYKAEGQALSVAADPSLAEQVAGGARSTLNKVKGVPEANARIKDTMIQRLVIENALRKSSGEWTPIHIGPLSIGAKLPRERLGQLALLLGEKRFQAYMRQSPRAAAALIGQIAQPAKPDATSGK